MTVFSYRAVSLAGRITNGTLDAVDQRQALLDLRKRGVAPIEIAEAAGGLAQASRARSADRQAAAKAIGELGVLFNAGLSIDRALALALENIDRDRVRGCFATILAEVREGAPLSRAIVGAEVLFPPMAQAMIEAGESNGRLGDALARLAVTLARAADLRRTVVNAMIYPVALMVIAVGVVLLMLLFVVPQFEGVFATMPTAKLPAASRAVMAASRWLRHYGAYLLVVLLMCALLLRQLARRPQLRIAIDRWVLHVPQIGTIVSYSQTALFTQTLAVLVSGGVDLPIALDTAKRSLSNSYFAAAVTQAATELKQGGGLSAPLAATGAFPRLALGFFRTGEETSQLGVMLERLADVLEDDVRFRLQRLIAVLTPTVTVLLGGVVATIIASIMSAILGFNDLAAG